ncbi:MAG: GldG family protein [Planctomycetota bacterium]
MNRTIRAILGVVFILIITFCAISICQNIGKRIRMDITARKLYTLSGGTRSILGKLRQPLRVKLYYAKTAALKGPDQIQYFNNYYQFVKALLEEYVAAANGMIDLEIIDPRPFSEEEAQALRYGLRRFSITEEENFFFGLVVQTQFGADKVIPFFSPDRQNFVEYDISYLIDTAVTRDKRRIGILSSLPVMGDDVTGYMAQMMRMQGQQPRPAWGFVEQLRQKYDVTKVDNDVNEIKDIDILLVIHPKSLEEKTLFAIDQFILSGGRTIICVDPHCYADQPDRMAMQMGSVPSQSSQLNSLLRTWGLEMPENKFAGDRDMAIRAPIGENQRPEKLIGFLDLTGQCLSRDSVITADLNQIKVLFAGVLNKLETAGDQDNQIEYTTLLKTTDQGNTWSVSSPYELMMPDPARLMSRFMSGTKPVVMGYMVTGRFKSCFPDGIEVEVDSGKTDDANEPEKLKKTITGLTAASETCAVAVFSDVDFISDMLAYRNSFFGRLVIGDNSSLLLNAVDDLGGSSDLISIRSRGNFTRPFIKVEEIERKAEAETAEEVARINAEIAGFETELRNLLASNKEEEKEIIGSSIVQRTRDLELKKRLAERKLRDVQMKRRQSIDQLGNILRNFCMLIAPAVILIIAIVLSVSRSMRKRHYISHASDA